MPVAVICFDAPGEAVAQARAGALAAHKAYVDERSELLLLSGPLIGSADGARAGQLFVLDVDGRDAARRFINEDPFTQAGVFAEVRIHVFEPRFRDGRRV